MRNTRHAAIVAARRDWHLRKQIASLASPHLPHDIASSFGALFGLLVVAFVSRLFQPHASSTPLLLAPVGATSVLVFLYPQSPLSQPWPAIGGSFISALVGVTMAWLIPIPAIAAACAVAGAIMAMSLMRCLHPPGGAAALLTVVGGQTLKSSGYWLAINPISTNACVIVISAMIWRKSLYAAHECLYPRRSRKITGKAE